MKRINPRLIAALLAFLLLSVAGCQVTHDRQVTPDRLDTTSPNLVFYVFYQNATLDSQYDAIAIRDGLTANRCIYVASPFRVVVLAWDPGGIGLLQIGTPGSTSLRAITSEIRASPSPDSPTQEAFFGGGYSNPGAPANSSGVRVTYEGGRVHDVAFLHAVYEFVPQQVPYSVLSGTAYNSSAVPRRSEVTAYFVRRAGAGPNERPGMPCVIPAIP